MHDPKSGFSSPQAQAIGLQLIEQSLDRTLVTVPYQLDLVGDLETNQGNP